jgi:hypothetical protein
MSPQRIQLSRAKGWRMPENTVKVTRPGKWGNPFNFKPSECCWMALAYGCRGDAAGRQEASVRAFREWIEAPPGSRTKEYTRRVMFGNDDKSIELGRAEAGEAPSLADMRRDLAGRNLACWCKLGAPCHADVLLELANAPGCEEV